MSDTDQQQQELNDQEAAMEAEFSATDHTPAKANDSIKTEIAPVAGENDEAKPAEAAEGAQASETEQAAPAGQGTPKAITYEDFEKFKGEIAGEFKKINGAVGGLKGYVQNLSKKAATETTAAGGDTPSASQVAKAMQDSEEYAKMKQEYPEFGAAMDKQMGVLKEYIIESMPKGMDADSISSLVSKGVAEQVDKFVTNFNQAQWTDAHPTWQQDINSAPFVEWIGKQLPEVQALADSQNYRDGLSLLNKFYESKKPAGGNSQQQSDAQQRNGQQQRNKRLEASLSPTDGNSRGSGTQAHLSEEDAMEQSFQSHSPRR